MNNNTIDNNTIDNNIMSNNTIETNGLECIKCNIIGGTARARERWAGYIICNNCLSHYNTIDKGMSYQRTYNE